MSFATLNGKRAQSVDLAASIAGAWFADVVLETAEELRGTVSLAFGGQTFAGTIIASGSYAGASGFRIVGGAAGWRKKIKAKSYTSSSGVNASTVIGDAAREVGETIGKTPSGSLGGHWVRVAGPASKTIAAATNGSWWVDFDGKTYTGARSSSPTATSGVLVELDVPNRIAVFASETVAEFVPGRVMSIGPFGAFKIGTVRHKITADSIRTELIHART